MNDRTYQKFIEAKNNKDLNTMEELYYSNSNDKVIKFEYAKLLILKGKKDLGKKLLLELLETKSGTYAKLELGRLEASIGNIEQARMYFESLLNTKNETYAKLELGRLEASAGNIEQARMCFKSLIGTNNETYAKLELGRLEASVGNIEQARMCFKSLIKTQNDNYAKLELGRLEANVGNIEQSRMYFESLLNTRNKNYAKLELGRLEASIGNIEQARMYFESLLKTKNKIPALTELIVLEYKLKNYVKALKLIEKMLKKYVVDHKIIISISKELNIFLKNVNYDNLKNNYLINQILDYDEYIAIEHTIERHCNSEEKNNFNKNIDIYKIFNNIKNMLNEEHKINKLLFNDYYLIPYEIIGSKGENYLLVVTLPNTKDIITMYPVFNQYDDCEEEKNYLKK